jgi:hypothetical protein
MVCAKFSFTQVEISSSYAFKGDAKVKKFEWNDDKITSDTYTAFGGTIFKVVKLYTASGETGYVIKFWKFSEPNEDFLEKKGATGNAKSNRLEKLNTIQTGKKEISYTTNGEYFYISENDFAKYSSKDFVPKYTPITFGAVALPLKMRFGNKSNRDFDFVSNITLGAALGVKRRIGESPFSNKSWNFLIGFGLTNVEVSPITLPGIVTETSNMTAVTPFVGVTYDIGKFQMGVFTGIDILGKGGNKVWLYRNSPWLSVGLGFQIFGEATKKADGENKNK